MIYVLITPDTRAILDAKHILLRDSSTFKCGHCSRPAAVVYHNVIGEHIHVKAEEYSKLHSLPWLRTQFCKLCQRSFGRGYSRHLTSVAHEQRARLVKLLQTNCLTYAEIGARLGITRERVRQLAGQFGSLTGTERRDFCRYDRQKAVFQAIPFVQQARQHGIDLAPYRLRTKWSETIFLYDKQLICLRISNVRLGSPYYVLRKTKRVDPDIFVWSLPSGDYVILPKAVATFKSQTMFSMREVLPGEKGCADTTNHHYFRYLNAWHELRPK